MITEKLRQIFDCEGLTIYGASQLIGADTDEPIKVIHQRLSRWFSDEPSTLKHLEATVKALGYTIKIEKNDQS